MLSPQWGKNGSVSDKRLEVATMANIINGYTLMVAHSSDTSGFVGVAKTATAHFCNEFNKYNQSRIQIEVKDFNDAVFSTASEDETQEVVFEQFAGHPDIVIALIGERLGEGLKKELESFAKEGKQTFLYLYDGGFRVYKEWHTYEERLKSFKSDMDEIYKRIHNRGFAKIFANKDELTSHIVDDLGRYIKHRHRVKYELADKSYARFAFDEVDRYRKEISSLIADPKTKDLKQAIAWINDHSRSNILELMRTLRTLLSEEYCLDMEDITISFAWGYHDPKNENEKVIRLDQECIISLNHSGTPAKLNELLRNPNSLLRYMIVNGVGYKWYQYKSYACMKGRYWWPDAEKSEMEKCMSKHGVIDLNATIRRTCKVCKNKDLNQTDSKEDQFGGSIFCYRIALNGDGAKTNNYVLSYIMVSTYRKPFTNTTHGMIRNEVEQRIKSMIDYRIRPQLLVELSQLYISYLYNMVLSDEGHLPEKERCYEDLSDYEKTYWDIEREIEDRRSMSCNGCNQ